MQPTTPILAIFQTFNLNLEYERQTLNVGKSTSLLQHVQVFRKLVTLITTLGLPSPYNDLKAQGQCVCNGGFLLKSADVLTILGWSLSTYTKKATAFFWAETAHKWQWNTEPILGMFVQFVI